MASINLVTGYTGEAHVRSEDDALLNSFLAGQDNAVINLESDFNDIDCDITCDALVGGRLTRTDGAVNLTFTKPSSGYYRYDGVYIVYKKVTSGIESAELVYCEGTENAAQATAEQNMGQPTISADVVASSVLQLYTVAWDNAQSKTTTANVVQGKESDAEIASMGGAFFEDDEVVFDSCYCAGIVTAQSNSNYSCYVTLPLPKTLKAGQTLSIPVNTMSARIYFTNGAIADYEGQNFSITDSTNNWCTIMFADDGLDVSKRGNCTVLLHYYFHITR